jgi:hypothetical protein
MPYVFRARVCDGFVQSVQRLAPVRNNGDRTYRARDYLLESRAAGFVICPNRADGFNWYLAPSDVPFVAFATAQNDTILGGYAVLTQDTHTVDVHICVSISPV